MLENQELISFSDDEIQKTKKFVVQIYSDNINFIENLSYQDKNDLINDLITDYRQNSNINQENTKKVETARNTIVILLAIIIGIPLILYLAGLSFNMTKSNYMYMQKNFEKLF